jgi:DNA replication and repair protein RecF
VYISGANGAGKTSVIEAIFYLYTLRTFRSQTLNEIRTFGADYLRVHGEFDPTNAAEFTTATLFHQHTRKVLLDGEPSELSAIDYSYLTPTICYSPSFETLLSSEHGERRQSLDRFVYYTDKSHMLRVKQHGLILQRKRAELASDEPDKAVLAILNEQLAPLSEAISSSRSKFVAEINAMAQSMPASASLLMADMELSLNINSMAERDFAKELEGGRPLYGCQKDLLYVKKQGKVIEKFQSFGQKKSLLLYLLYNTARVIGSWRKSDISLLFDDFEAGLDAGRTEALRGLFTGLARSGGHTQLMLSGIVNTHYEVEIGL